MPSYTLPGGTIKFEETKTNGKHVAVAASGGGVTSLSVGDSATLTGGSWTSIASPQAHIRDAMQGTPGSDLAPPWELSNSSGINPKYTDTQPWAGSTCAEMNFENGQFRCRAEITDLNDALSVYASYRVRTVKLTEPSSRNQKYMRLVGKVENGQDKVPTIGSTILAQNDSHQVYYNNDDLGTDPIGYWEENLGNSGFQSWNRAELFSKLSDPGSSNGRLGEWFNGDGALTENVMTRVSGITEAFNIVVLPFYTAHDDGGDYFMYVADVFVTTNMELARVEISNDATYNQANAVPVNCTRRTSSEADIDIPLSNLDLSSTVYAYVFEPDGTRIDYGAIN